MTGIRFSIGLFLSEVLPAVQNKNRLNIPVVWDTAPSGGCHICRIKIHCIVVNARIQYVPPLWAEMISTPIWRLWLTVGQFRVVSPSLNRMAIGHKTKEGSRRRP